MEQLEFQQWWKEFQYNHQKDNDNGKSSLNELKWTLSTFSQEKRVAFINDLLSNREFVYAYDLIPLYGNQKHKKKLRSKLFIKLIFDNKSQILDDLVLAILRTFNVRDYLILRLYFFIIKDFNVSVLSELYNIDKDYFLIVTKKLIRDTSDFKIEILCRVLFKKGLNEFLKGKMEKDKSEILRKFYKIATISQDYK